MTIGAGRVLRRLPLRARLVAGFLVAMLILLTAAGAFVYWRVQYALDRGLDSELSRATAVIAPLVGPSGRITALPAADATGTGWQVLDATGAVVDAGGPVPPTALASAGDLARVRAEAYTKDIGSFLPASDHPYRLHVTSVGAGAGAGAGAGGGGGSRYLAVVVRRDHRDEALRELLLQLVLAGGGALVGAAVVGDVLARAALRPVERYRSQAQQIAGGTAGVRLDVPTGRDDEVTRLGHTLNDMLAAMEDALENERRFVNDASHELRTPLTLLKTRIQMARRRARDSDEHERILDELGIDVSRLARLADQLLVAGTTASGAPTTDARDVVRSVVARRHAAADDLDGHLSHDLGPEPAPVAVDPLALERVVTNLIDNAFSHGAPPVGVRVEQRVDPAGHAWVVIEVSDSGPGMSADLLADATKRFARAPEARSRPGSGLGLSIVETIVTAAGGELRLCHRGVHASHGRAVDLTCPDHGAMSATVILP